MAVVYYQLFIIGTILVAYLGVDHLRRWTGRRDLTPLRAAALAGAGWSLFTLTHVVMPHLMAVQMLTIWGTVGVLWHLRRQRAALEDIRRQLADAEPWVVERVVDMARTQPLRVIAGRAHQRELRRALDGAEQSLVILSGWASDYVIDGDFRRRLGHTLGRGVDVYIGYGWTAPSRPSPPSASEARAIGALEALAREAERWGGGRLRVARWPNHAKMLICDERYAICGSHNWLSNAGFSNEERSWVVLDPAFVRREREEIIGRITSASEARVAS